VYPFGEKDPVVVSAVESLAMGIPIDTPHSGIGPLVAFLDVHFQSSGGICMLNCGLFFVCNGVY
jgi:hypothetical protein